MKKIYFILAAAVSMLFATEANAQISVGAGYTLGTKTVKVGDEKGSNNYHGVYVEALYDWTFIQDGWGNLGLEPGVRFSYLSDSETEEVLGQKVKGSDAETYLDIPVSIKYSYDLGSVRLSAYAGPVVSLGLTSVNKSSVKGDNIDYVSKYYNYTGKTVVKGEGGVEPSGMSGYGRFDLKLGLGVAATISDALTVKVGYNIGLLDRYTPADDTFKIKTNVLYVGVGFNF